MISTRPLPPNGHYPVPGYSTPHREPMARHAGRDDTLNPDPRGVGTNGLWSGRDVTSSNQPYNEGRGMFSRLHEGGG